MNTIAVHLNHDSTLSINLDGTIRNIELERLYGKRNYDWRQEGGTLDDLVGIIQKDQRSFDVGIIIGEQDQSAAKLFGRLGVAETHRVDHHVAHAAVAFYQSPHDQSLIISYDGGGNDGMFRAFVGCRNSGIRPIEGNWALNLGIPYRALAHPIADIRKPDDGRELSNAGKLMGLSAYGQVRHEWIAPISAYFYECSTGGDIPERMYLWTLGHLPKLGAQLGICLDRDAITGTDAFDLARTAQHVFETLFLERVLPLVAKYRLPICITGGCALNVLTNQRLAKLVEFSIFVPPNPNDSGLALGGLLSHSPPKDPVNATYSGASIIDIASLATASAKFNAVEIRPKDVARLIYEGRVVGVMRGNSEHGPRALGNRSILCAPSIPNMKARLNSKIKFRESFRPYAPVVRLCDISQYFENAGNDMSFMSFNPTLKPKWRTAFASAVHVDGTARVQSVTAQQNSWLYDLLTEFERLSGYGALLNTSFNSKGLPMLTCISEALRVFFETDIDCLVIENLLFRKPGIKANLHNVVMESRAVCPNRE